MSCTRLTDLARPFRVGGLVCAVVVIGLLGVFSASASASELPEVEKKNMVQIEQWVYRLSAVKSPVPCEELCVRLWNAEHGSLPQTSGTQQTWDALGFLETERTGLWTSMEQMRLDIGELTLGLMPFSLGFHFKGTAEGTDKWMVMSQPAAPAEAGHPECGFEGSKERIFGPGWEYPTVHEPSLARPKTTTWTWWAETLGCRGGVGYFQEHALEGCSGNTARPPKWPGPWVEEEVLESVCENHLLEPPPHEKVNDLIQVATRTFHFGRPEEYTGQKAEVERGGNSASDPGTTVVKEATERILEEWKWIRVWVQWVLEKEPGVNPLVTAPPEEEWGHNPSEPNKPQCTTGKPVNCATGNEVESETDLSVGGRGPGLNLTRVYNAQLAAQQTVPGIFGYGWSGPYTASISLSEEGTVALVHQDDGSVVEFQRSGEAWKPLNPVVQSTLAAEGTGYAFTLPNQTVLHFNSSGLLTSEADRNGNTLSMSRNAEGRLESVSDPAGRKLTYAYNTEGRVESVTDPLGHAVKYGYEGGNLTSVTLPGETGPRWQYKYDASHRLTTLTDGRGGKTTLEYDSSNRVISETDPAERTLSFAYEASRTKITNKATGAVTDEHFSADNEPVSITHGYGTASATTEEMGYDSAGNLTSVTDGDKHTTSYTYNSAGDRTSMTDAAGDETKWEYNGTHDLTGETRPNEEKTTIERDSHGNALTVSRPAPASTTQTTKYTYTAAGLVETMTDPLGHAWKYEYDNAGDRTVEVDPEGDKRTWAYDEDSRLTSTVSPRGNVEGAEASKYTTKTERDAQGRPTTITDPLGHKTKYAYDAGGNLESETDANGHTTKYSYDADNELTKLEKPNTATVETGYDGAGEMTSQTDGNKHVTKYTRNILEQVTEITDPLGRKTLKEYDAAGNLKKLTDQLKRATTYTYDAANRLTEVSFSSGNPTAIKYEYDKDSNRVKLVDATGTSTYSFDQLDRLTESKDGHGNVAKYEYDLGNELTKLTYPNGKAVTRTFDKADRLQKVTDWLANATTFGYSKDSYLTSTAFPSASGNEDKYAYNEADQMSEAAMLKGTETLASLTYTRDNDGQLASTTQKGLPGEEKPGDEYDANSRLTKAGASGYGYDAADNPTTTPGSTNTFDAANEIKTGTNVSYAYDEVGERTKMTPSASAAFTYGYNQAGEMTSVERPKEGKVAELKDTFAYDGNALRVSQTISGKTSYLAWGAGESLPVILNDGTNSYIYGPGDLPVEQINAEGKVLYLHHDQQGSTRLLSSSTGAKEAAFTYSAYGETTGTTGTATTPLGYDGQYTSSDTGLIYLRARVYDPKTAQFMTVDPLAASTRSAYGFAGDSPINGGDPTGMGNWLNLGIPSPGEVLETLNPIKYYEDEIHSYENGCGYWASVAHGIEGAAVAATDATGLAAIGKGVAGLAAANATEDAGVAATAHGAEMLAARGFTADDIAITESGTTLTQADGATVYLKEIAPGRFNVIVQGSRGIVTALKNIPQGAVERLAKNYGWK